jgi:hypothetical protein
MRRTTGNRNSMVPLGYFSKLARGATHLKIILASKKLEVDVAVKNGMDWARPQ